MSIKTVLMAALACSGSLALPGMASASVTILDFAGAICGATGTDACGSGSQIGQSYDDTAGVIDVSYRSITNATGVTYEPYLKHWGTGYGDLAHVAWGGTDATNHQAEIVFTPAAGYEVALLGFDFGCYQNRTSCQTLNYGIESLGGTAIDAGALPTLYPGHGTLALGALYVSDGIRLVWGPDSYDVGLANIAFDVRLIDGTPPPVVPEPASWAMMIAGLGIVGSVLRRSRPRLAFA